VWSQDDNALPAPYLQPISDWFAIAGANSVAYPGKSAQTFSDVSPGTYTLQLSGNNGAAGIAIAEVFEADRTTDRITCFSARAYVGVGESIAIPGFVIRGDAPLRVLVRGVGPALARFGVSDVLADPTMQLVDSSGRVVASNDNWQNQPSASDVANAAAKVGAFALADGSHDAAVLLILNPGAYTALISGTGNSTGVALMEVYEVR
jgi:hypothetical protein